MLSDHQQGALSNQTLPQGLAALLPCFLHQQGLQLLLQAFHPMATTVPLQVKLRIVCKGYFWYPCDIQLGYGYIWVRNIYIYVALYNCVSIFVLIQCFPMPVQEHGPETLSGALNIEHSKAHNIWQNKSKLCPYRLW